MLKINHVNKKYGHLVVLDNISLEVEQTSIIGLAGPSGGGKSTLLRCIQQLEAIDSGSIVCNGHTGFMFQDFQLFPHMTVLRNLVYAPNLTSQNKENEAAALALLTNLGIADKAHVYPQNLSGGQKQRVALARSLMMQPDVLLCDEPTSGLDVATILDVVELLQSVQALGVTMVIASHDLDFLTKIADKIVILNHGTIVADINPKTTNDPVALLKNYY